MTGQVFTSSLRVRFAHCDPAGIVFYPRYFEMINGVVEDWFDQGLKRNFASLHMQDGRGVPTVSVECQFLAPARLGERLDFELRVVELGSSSCRVAISAFSQGLRVLQTVNVLVLVDMQKQPFEATQIPPELRQRMAEYLSPGAPDTY